MIFSIITITFNSHEYLEKTIDSVLSQDFVDFEYILVDGGSTDSSLEIIQRYAAVDARIRWISEPDNGISDAFNKGIRMAVGEIIGIINSDDYYLPGALSAVAAAYLLHAGVTVFHGDMLRLDGEIARFRLVPSDVTENIWHEMPLNHPATFITRRAYEQVGGFDSTIRIAMDYDLLLRMFKAGQNFFYIPHALAAMRYGGASDDRHMDGLREVRAIAIREGYSGAKAWFWFGYKVCISSVKNGLRRLGLFRLLHFHPRFRRLE